MAGDTAWAAPIAATQSEWQSYVLKRKSQKFNVIQVHTGSGFLSRTTDRNANAPFTDSGTGLQWNPAYWQGVEQKVQYANDQGMLVFFAAVRQPGPGFPESDATQVQRFARGLAARMMGNFVVYSPVADDVWTSLADTSGNALQSATSLHLVTAHPRFHLSGSTPAMDFHGKPYVDFAGLQSARMDL